MCARRPARGWSPQVTELGKALTSADVRDRTFILAGFTDAKGSQTYNQGLSERRADAVRQLLSKEYGIDAGNPWRAPTAEFFLDAGATNLN